MLDDMEAGRLHQARGAVQFKWDRYDEMTGEDHILEVKNLKQHFPIYRGFFQRVVDTPRP